MDDKKDDYIKYIKKVIIEFQKTREVPLLDDDMNVILKLIELEINRGVESRISILNIIRKALENAIEINSYNNSRIDDLKDLKRLVKYRSIIKKSPLLSHMIKNKKVDLDKINDNIPSINCEIENDCLLLSSVGKDEERTIYEIRKGDQCASICEEDLISVKELYASIDVVK